MYEDAVQEPPATENAESPPASPPVLDGAGPEGAGPEGAAAAADIARAAGLVRENVARVVVGAEETVTRLMVALLTGGHVLLEDVPGTGKTTLARAVARSLGASFSRIQFTPDLMPSDIVGINYYSQKSGEFEYRAGPLHANVVLADEINRATPRTQSALLEAMQEHTVTVDGDTRPLPQPFVVLATQNPVELEGTFPLPEAQLDRFLLRLRIGYPSEEGELEVLRRFRERSPLDTLAPVLEAEELLALTGRLPRIHVEDEVARYVARLCRATREHEAFELGASPRATLALFEASRAYAAIDGRDYVRPDDVKQLAHPVLAHRLLLSSQTRLRGGSVDDVLDDILRELAVPVADVAPGRG